MYPIQLCHSIHVNTTSCRAGFSYAVLTYTALYCTDRYKATDVIQLQKRAHIYTDARMCLGTQACTYAHADLQSCTMHAHLHCIFQCSNTHSCNRDDLLSQCVTCDFNMSNKHNRNFISATSSLETLCHVSLATKNETIQGTRLLAIQLAYLLRIHSPDYHLGHHWCHLSKQRSVARNLCSE